MENDQTKCIEEKDNEEDLNAFMLASSNIRQSVRGSSSTIPKKKSKYVRDLEASLALLSHGGENNEEEKAFNFAQAFIMKVAEKLDADDFQAFLIIFDDFGQSFTSVIDLFHKVENVLKKKYPDLIEEFLAFLSPEQALMCGKFMDYLLITKMKSFFNKLEIYFAKQPQQMRKIYSSLCALSGQTNVTLSDVRSTILPLLKGNQLLTDSFLEMFDEGSPPTSILVDYEEMGCIEVDSENAGEEDFVETFNIPEEEDRYGGENCSCKCHDSSKEKYQNRMLHCIPCGTKFINGKVYIQTGKILRPAKVTFSGDLSGINIERLSSKQRVKRTKRHGKHIDPLNPIKYNSPTKSLIISSQHNSIVNDHSVFQKKTNKKRKAGKQKSICGPNSNSEKTSNKSNSVLKSDKTENVNFATKSFNNRITRLGSAPGTKRTADDTSTKIKSRKRPIKLSPKKTNSDSKSTTISKNSLKIVCKKMCFDQLDPKPSMKSSKCHISEPNDSPREFSDQITTEKNWEPLMINIVRDNEGSSLDIKDECPKDCQVSSDDSTWESTDVEEVVIKSELNCESPNNDVDPLLPSNADCNAMPETLWTKDEDKIILQMFQQEPAFRTFTLIKEKLPNRNLEEIQQRFKTLMSILQDWKM